MTTQGVRRHQYFNPDTHKVVPKDAAVVDVSAFPFCYTARTIAGVLDYTADYLLRRDNGQGAILRAVADQLRMSEGAS